MSQFKLIEQRWYAWQMIPGYIGERSVPYCSPIYINSVTPLKKGNGTIRIEFLNALYSQGVQTFDLELKVLKRAKDYLLGDLVYTDQKDSDRSVVISHIEFEWVKRFCPDLWFNRPPSSCQNGGSISFYLNEVFFRKTPES